MGHLQDMSKSQRSDFLTHKYLAAKESRRGNEFEWYNEEKHETLLNKKGYNWFKFDDGKNYTASQLYAQEIVSKLRNENNFARIVCGMEQCVQRIRYFSVIYKPKMKKPTV